MRHDIVSMLLTELYIDEDRSDVTNKVYLAVGFLWIIIDF